MVDFPRQFSRLTFIVLLTSVELSGSVHFCLNRFLADEQKIVHDTSSTFEIELSVRGKLKFPAGSDLRADSLEIIEQPVHAHSNLIYRQNASIEESKMHSTVVRHYERAVAKAVVGEDCINTQLTGSKPTFMCVQMLKGSIFGFTKDF